MHILVPMRAANMKNSAMPQAILCHMTTKIFWECTATSPNIQRKKCRTMLMGVPDHQNDNEHEESHNRLENLYWCSCSSCQLMPSAIECRCCKEFQNILGEKLAKNINCVTQNSHFTDICIRRHVLETAYVQRRRYMKNYKEIKSLRNK